MAAHGKYEGVGQTEVRNELRIAIANAKCVYGGRNGDGVCHHGYAPNRHFVHSECALAAVEAHAGEVMELLDACPRTTPEWRR